MIDKLSINGQTINAFDKIKHINTTLYRIQENDELVIKYHGKVVGLFLYLYGYVIHNSYDESMGFTSILIMKPNK